MGKGIIKITPELLLEGHLLLEGFKLTGAVLKGGHNGYIELTRVVGFVEWCRKRG